MENRPNESEALAAKAVARAPAPLLRALDRLETAGWKFEELGLPSFAPVVHRFNELLKNAGLYFAARVTEIVCNSPHVAGKNFSHVLISGFDGAHWAEWFFFSCAARSTWQKAHDRARRTPRKPFPMSIFAGLAPGRSLVRSPNAYQERTAINPARRFAFSEYGNARRRGNGKAFRFLIAANFSEQPKRSHDNAFVIGQMRMHAAGRDFSGQRGLATAGRELAGAA